MAKKTTDENALQTFTSLEHTHGKIQNLLDAADLIMGDLMTFEIDDNEAVKARAAMAGVVDSLQMLGNEMESTFMLAPSELRSAV